MDLTGAQWSKWALTCESGRTGQIGLGPEAAGTQMVHWLGPTRGALQFTIKPITTVTRTARNNIDPNPCVASVMRYIQLQLQLQLHFHLPLLLMPFRFLSSNHSFGVLDLCET